MNKALRQSKDYYIVSVRNLVVTGIQGRASCYVHETREVKMKQFKNSQLFKKRKSFIFSAVFVLTLGILLATYTGYVSAAGNTISVVAIDYEEETITLQANEGDTKIFYSNKSQTTWDTVYGTIDKATKQITMDISWITKTSSYVLSFKGDKSTTPITVTLPKQSSTFRVSIDYSTNLLRFSNYGSATKAYWRKADSTVWNEMTIGDTNDLESFKNDVERFSLKGITLYFRLGQVKGTSKTDVGSRPSKEVALKITKRAAAPSIKTDFDKGTIPVKSTMQYKMEDNEEWIDVRGNSLSLKDLAAVAYYSDTNKDPKDVLIDIRTKATNTKVASQRVTIKVPAQEQTLTDISISYIGATQAELNITKKVIEVDGEKVTLEAPSSTNPYEYTIVKEDGTLTDTATWTTITSSSVKITKEKAPVGSKLYVRKKATATTLATVPYKMTISGYPDPSTVTTTELKKVSGVETSFTFALTVPSKDTGISSIKFNDTEVKFTAKKAKLFAGSDKYTMDVTITDVTDVEAIAENLETTLTAVITLNNGDIIKEGVTLYISPATKVEKKKSYEKYLDISFDETITFNLNLNSEKKSGVTVSKITYNNQDVKFKQVTDTDELQIEVTIDDKSQFDEIENNLSFSKQNTEIPFVITLSSDEVISEGITLKIKPIVTLSSSSNGFGISAGTYKAALETESTADDIENPVVKLTIDEKIYKENDLMISSVSWNDREIIGTYSNVNNETSLTLSIANMIDGLNFTNQSSYSGFVTVTLKDKYNKVFKEIITNFKITVVK